MDSVRIGCIGAGWWATTNHMPVLAKRPDVELAAVCRIGQRQLRDVQDEFGFAFATEDYRELVAQPLDGVVVASPHDLHYEHAKAALEAGLHVLVEKPMSLQPSQAWDLHQTANARDVELMVSYGWHFSPLVRAAKQRMNRLGTIEHVVCHMASSLKDFFGGHGRTERESADPHAWAGGTWRDPERGGGYLHGQLSHATGLLFWLTDLRASEVSARFTGPNADVDLYDAATVVFANGASGVVSGAATLPAGEPFQVELRIFGSEGVMDLDLETERLEVRRHDGERERVALERGSGFYDGAAPTNAFIEVIRERASNESPGWCGVRSVELLYAMETSAAEGGHPVLI